MFETEPVRYEGIWHKLPLRAKAAACLLLPVPVLGLTVIGLGILGVHQFQFLTIPAVALELLVLAWVLQATHHWICQLKSATDRLCEGESLPGMPPYSWELNAISRNLESLAATLQQHRREIAESREEAARLFDDASSAYLETDAQGAVKRANRSACRLLGRTVEEVCQMHVWDLFGATEGPTSQKRILEKAVRTEDGEAFDKEYIRPDGARLVVGLQESPLRDLTGSLTGIRYILNDWTPRVRAVAIAAHCEKQLQLNEDQLTKALVDASEARRAKSRFLSNVSNDLRVPLNTIIGFAELLLDRKVGAKSAERREFLGDILSSGRELTRAVDHLLDLGKWESVKEPVGHKTAGLAEFVYDLDYLMQVVSQGRGARIQVHLDPEVQFTTADRETVRLLVGTYLSYALKRAPDGGAVMVRTLAEGSSGYRLEVEYRGVPSEQPDNERLTLDLETDAELAEVIQLVEKHSGRAGVHAPPGRGIVLYAVLHPANELAHGKAAAGPVLESVAQEAGGIQGLAKVLGEISGAENTLGVHRCHESTAERNVRPRLKSLAGTRRKRSA